MYFELEEFNLKVVMMGLETTVETVLGMGERLSGWGCHKTSLDNRGT